MNNDLVQRRHGETDVSGRGTCRNVLRVRVESIDRMSHHTDLEPFFEYQNIKSIAYDLVLGAFCGVFRNEVDVLCVTF